MTTYLELKAKAEKMLADAEELRVKEVAAVIAEIKEKISQFGISAKDLGFSTSSGYVKKSSAAPATPSVAKFVGPNGEHWSGMGRQPQWIKDAIASGKTKDDFAV